MKNGDSPSDHLRKIFVGGLSAYTNEESLQSFFAQFGNVIDTVVMRDQTTQRPRGFGFVTFDDTNAVDKVQNLRPHAIDGKTVDTKRAQPRGESFKPDLGETAKVKKIFIGGLKECHDEESLKQHFSQFGNVAGIKVLIDKGTGRKRGFAFLEFDDCEAVEKATQMNKHTICFTLVEVKKCITKPDFTKRPYGAPNGSYPGYNVQHEGAPDAYNQAPYGVYPTPQAAVPAYDNGYAGGYMQATAGGYAQHPQQVAAYDPYGHAAAAAAAAAAQPMNGAWHAYGGGPTAAPFAGDWTHGGYGAAAAANAGNIPPPAATGMPAQPFGEYKQAYNGGPQKANYLQNKRVNPYSANAAATNYGI